MMLGSQSCMSSRLVNPAYDNTYSNDDPVYASKSASTPVYYQGRNYTASGVRIIGHRTFPIGLMMLDMQIIRNGLIVQITDGTGSRLIKQYDLRVRQDVEDVFHATSLNGVPIEVTVVVHGPDQSNYVKIADGGNVNVFQLRRN